MVWAAQLPPGARLGWQAGHYLVGLRAEGRAVQEPGFQLEVSRPVVAYKHSMSIAYGGCL
jgi:hypothetical protein